MADETVSGGEQRSLIATTSSSDVPIICNIMKQMQQLAEAMSRLERFEPVMALTILLVARDLVNEVLVAAAHFDTSTGFRSYDEVDAALF
jgi:hypothetical protein